MKFLLKIFVLLTSFTLASLCYSIERFDHSAWNALLVKYVSSQNNGQSTQVDYAGFLKDRVLLTDYLEQLSRLSQVSFDQLSKAEQLAFLINAYNAWTVEYILTAYPKIDSIKDLGGFFSSPWKNEFIPLLGATRSLDDIEHELIRGSGRYHDVRIHFAVNCASIGCPALRAEAYTGKLLDQQLEDQTKLFLSDNSRNRISKGILEVSSIFKWYREDFEKGWSGIDSLEAFFAVYSDVLKLTDQQVIAVQNGSLDIEFLDYDWRLNKK